MFEEKKIKRNITFSIIAIFLLIIILSGSTYAYFSTSESTGIQEITTAKLDVAFTEGDTINYDFIVPLHEEEINNKAYTISFSLDNNSTDDVVSEISFNNIVMSDELKDTYFKWRLLENDVVINEGDFIGVSNSRLMDKITINKNEDNTYKVMLWLQENYDNQNNLQQKSFSANILVESFIKKDEYVESGVNAPDLANGMIPVVYNEVKNVWEKADITKEWYNYSKQKWANAVTVSSISRSKYLRALAGTEIPMDDINSMWVWIPRFKYNIPSNMGSSDFVSNPPEINVIFENGIETTGVDEATYRNNISTDGTNTNYYTHPAFRDGSLVFNDSLYDIGGWNYELEGFWVGKFESGTSNVSCSSIVGVATPTTEPICNEVDPIIKPDIPALRFQDVSSQFITALKFSGGVMNVETGGITYNGNETFGFEGTTVSHMAKTTEWSAVAYLSQSKYGKYGNSNYSSSNKEVYINNSGYGDTNEQGVGFYTGRSGGSPLAVSVNYGTFSYNNKTCSTSAECTGDIVNNSGTGASTTGNIYGVYDMNDGSWEYTMGNWDGYTGRDNTTVNQWGKKQNTSDFNGLLSVGGEKTDGIAMPEIKYYDRYSGINTDGIITKDLAILGDGTWETLRWYSDYYYTVDPSYPWMGKGGKYSYEESGGVFASNGQRGASYSSSSWRAILIP
ncbi:MAG: hypothetical protein E7166_03045 [Firmicutes bacterium]|nr:hypothetical protein [Bacillota bacterium]